MKYLILLILSLVSCSVLAGEYDRQVEADLAASEARARANGDAQFEAYSQAIGEKLAALNHTSVYFNSNARNSDGGMGEPLVAGEWVLGNGGVCVRSVYTQFIYCHNGVGFALNSAPAHYRHSKRGRK